MSEKRKDQRLAIREYPWGLSKFEADQVVGLVATRGYGTIIEAIADCAYDNGDEEVCVRLRQSAAELAVTP